MKIVLAEPLGVDQKIVDRFAEELSDMGHTFTSYDTVPSGQQELAGRIQDADAVMIANYPFREAAIRSDAALKYINIAFTGVDHVDDGLQPDPQMRHYGLSTKSFSRLERVGCFSLRSAFASI